MVPVRTVSKRFVSMDSTEAFVERMVSFEVHYKRGNAYVTEFLSHQRQLKKRYWAFSRLTSRICLNKRKSRVQSTDLMIPFCVNMQHSSQVTLFPLDTSVFPINLKFLRDSPPHFFHGLLSLSALAAVTTSGATFSSFCTTHLRHCTLCVQDVYCSMSKVKHRSK